MTFLALAAFASAVARASEPVVDCVEVKTRSADNPLVKVWYRVPRDYDPSGKGRMRTLILFGGRNCDGKTEVSGKLGWTEWADLNGIFLVAPTLKDDAYWSPEKWSGRALLDALSLLAARYRLSTEGLLFYGYSAGSQASNLFPAWRPDLCRAYVSHACGFFHAPASKMKVVSALVTCGDADTARYVISRRFVGGCRRLGVPVVWRSFPNHPHDVPPGSVRLAKEFLAHHHWSHSEDLGLPALPRRDVARFVGDDADGVYFAAGSAEAAGVMEEDRIDLPSEAVARAWGSPGRTERGSAPSVTTNQIDGVQVVSVVRPSGVRLDAKGGSHEKVAGGRVGGVLRCASVRQRGGADEGAGLSAGGMHARMDAVRLDRLRARRVAVGQLERQGSPCRHHQLDLRVLGPPDRRHQHHRPGVWRADRLRQRHHDRRLSVPACPQLVVLRERRQDEKNVSGGGPDGVGRLRRDARHTGDG